MWRYNLDIQDQAGESVVVPRALVRCNVAGELCWLCNAEGMVSWGDSVGVRGSHFVVGAAVVLWCYWCPWGGRCCGVTVNLW